MSCSRTTTQWHRWGSNPRPFGLESSTLPLSSQCPRLLKKTMRRDARLCLTLKTKSQCWGHRSGQCPCQRMRTVRRDAHPITGPQSTCLNPLGGISVCCFGFYGQDSDDSPVTPFWYVSRLICQVSRASPWYSSWWCHHIRCLHSIMHIYHNGTAKAQANLHTCAGAREHLQLAFTKYGCRWTLKH